MTGQERSERTVTMPTALIAILDMDFPHRLAALRKQQGLTQPGPRRAVGIHVSQLRRYEGGGAQPTLDVIRRLAVALSESAPISWYSTPTNAAPPLTCASTSKPSNTSTPTNATPSKN